MTSPRMLTVDRAAALLGLSHQGVIKLIGEGKLTWTMSGDRKTVLVELPSNPDESLPHPGTTATPSAKPPNTAARDPHAQNGVRSFDGEQSTISELDAWSQPK